jgi:hypothetical protein
VEAPRADRPHAPGYFIREYTDDLLPWSWAVDLMNRARAPILSTVRPDGRPHAMPIWGIWLPGGSGVSPDVRDVYCLSTAITSVKSNNLKANPECVITSHDGDADVVLEGRAEIAPLPDGFTDAYQAKYGEKIDEGPIWIVRPRVAFAFEANDNFYKTATRWTF